MEFPEGSDDFGLHRHLSLLSGLTVTRRAKGRDAALTGVFRLKCGLSVGAVSLSAAFGFA